MVETLCDDDAAILKAGENAPTLTAAEYTQLINQAEGFLSAQARYDFVTNYASVSAIGKEFLENAASSYAAIGIINHNMSGYTSRTEAQTMLDVNYSIVVEAVNLLRDDKFKEFIITGSVS